MTKESIIQHGHLNEIQRIHPELKLRIISKYTGEMLTYDASMNFRESQKIHFMGQIQYMMGVI